MSALLQPKLITLASHASNEARHLMDQALKVGDLPLADAVCSWTCSMLPSAEELEAELASDLVQQRSGVVVLVRPHDAPAAPALNEHQLER